MSGQAQPAPDPLARAAVVSVAVGRIGIGIGGFAFTGRALEALGFGQTNGAPAALVRIAGIRDIALGLYGLSAGSDRERLREAAALGAFVDAGDAVAFGTAMVRRDGIDRAAAISVPMALGATALGAWALTRL